MQAMIVRMILKKDIEEGLFLYHPKLKSTLKLQRLIFSLGIF